MPWNITQPFSGAKLGHLWRHGWTQSLPHRVKSESESESRSVVSNSLRSHGLYSPWNSPGQNTGVGSLSPLQGILPTQGSNPGLPHCRWILYQLSHKGSPRILEWVAYPFPSQVRNWVQIFILYFIVFDFFNEENYFGKNNTCNDTMF